MTYTHLTQQERCQIHALKRKNISVAYIAAELQRDRSTISRELKRNAGTAGYKPNLAHKHARAHQCERRNGLSFSPEQWNAESCIDLPVPVPLTPAVQWVP